MIIEQRVYELKPGSLHEFLKAYEAEGLATQREALGSLRSRRRAALSNNPQWRAFLGKVVTMVVNQRNELLAPASFSPIR